MNTKKGKRPAGSMVKFVDERRPAKVKRVARVAAETPRDGGLSALAWIYFRKYRA